MTAANHPPNERYINLIRHHPLFKGVDDTLFEQLIAHCQLLSYDKQEMVLHSKTERESLLLILEGSVEVFVSGPTAAKEEVLEILQAGDLIGLSSIAHFLGEPPHVNSQHNVGVRSIEPTHCLEIPFHVLEKRWPDEEVRHYLLRQSGQANGS
ncbi:hypothetical protein GCM10010965_07790 [Caldalkalibacillus thermarum]|uniref:cyclic nucleotide-binding domain-containing protein n=1 Tax=Caldalkalibacillus thermarum TaxID=296745 RepID=UPI001663F66B|nr:cyclic nucleotide-binding domain-containing protein [Caldalkalibacillus thermarum]GGK17199.1 hypothetical protein GCM10010965_07790 [Caldalkalibacillus thermarum]